MQEPDQPITLERQLASAIDADACFCVSCGQPDEPSLHDPARCPGMGGTKDVLTVAQAVEIYDQSCEEEPHLDEHVRGLHCAMVLMGNLAGLPKVGDGTPDAALAAAPHPADAEALERLETLLADRAWKDKSGRWWWIFGKAMEADEVLSLLAAQLRASDAREAALRKAADEWMTCATNESKLGIEAEARATNLERQIEEARAALEQVKRLTELMRAEMLRRPSSLASPTRRTKAVGEQINQLISQARRQRRSRMSLWQKLYSEGLVVAGQIVRHRPVRWLWQARTAWLLWRRWNAPKGHEARATLRQDWNYAGSLAELLDEAGDGLLSPSDAIAEDRRYWED